MPVGRKNQLLVPPDLVAEHNRPEFGAPLRANKHFSNGLEFLVNYTWSKSIDDASVGDDNVTWLGSFTSLQDPNKPWLERSLSTFDIPSVLKFSYSYDLPFGRGRALLGNMPRVLNAIPRLRLHRSGEFQIFLQHHSDFLDLRILDDENSSECRTQATAHCGTLQNSFDATIKIEN
jgi:hypothetical protein